MTQVKGTLRKDVVGTKESSSLSSNGSNSTFFSGKHRSIVTYLMIMVYMLAPVEGRVIRHAAGNRRGAGGANQRMNPNQRMSNKKGRGKKKPVANNNNNKKGAKKEEDQDNNSLPLATVGVREAIAVSAERTLARRAQSRSRTQQPQQPKETNQRTNLNQKTSGEEDEKKKEEDQGSSLLLRVGVVGAAVVAVGGIVGAVLAPQPQVQHPKPQAPQHQPKPKKKSKPFIAPPPPGAGGGCGGMGAMARLDLHPEHEQERNDRPELRRRPLLNVLIERMHEIVFNNRIVTTLQEIRRRRAEAAEAAREAAREEEARGAFLLQGILRGRGAIEAFRQEIEPRVRQIFEQYQDSPWIASVKPEIALGRIRLAYSNIVSIRWRNNLLDANLRHIPPPVEDGQWKSEMNRVERLYDLKYPENMKHHYRPRDFCPLEEGVRVIRTEGEYIDSAVRDYVEQMNDYYLSTLNGE
jgi:hypothetical protein